MRRFETFTRLIQLIDKQLNRWSIGGQDSPGNRGVYHEFLWLLDLETPDVMGIVG